MLVFIAFLIATLFGAYALGEDNEHRDKYDKEDKILHELTACQEDVKSIAYRSCIGHYRGHSCRLYIKN